VRVLFAGSPRIALAALEAASSGAELVGVLTNPASASGRGLARSVTPVAEAAARLGVPVLTFDHLGAEARAAVAPLGADLLISFAYGRVFGPRFLALFPQGGINIHPSLLPKYRGPTPIPAAILARDRVSGVTVQRLAAELDSGDILASGELVLEGRETTESLEERAAVLGAELLSRVLRELAAGKAVSRPQEGTVSFCPLLKKDDGLLDFSLGSEELDARVRAFYPWPMAFSHLKGLRLNILESFPYPGESWPTGPGDKAPEPGSVLGIDKARGLMVQTGDGLLALRRLQLQNKKALPYREFANGLRDVSGAVLGIPAGQEAGTNS
jgi:methionyl-tRNA formyltransferase